MAIVLTESDLRPEDSAVTLPRYAQRQWLAVDLESRAYDAMVTRIVLTR